MMSFQLQAAGFLWKYRYLFLLICFAITAAAATQLATLRVSNSLDMWYP
jgi:hypothetical protein